MMGEEEKKKSKPVALQLARWWFGIDTGVYGTVREILESVSNFRCSDTQPIVDRMWDTRTKMMDPRSKRPLVHGRLTD